MNEIDLYRNNLKNRFLATSAWRQIFSWKKRVSIISVFFLFLFSAHLGFSSNTPPPLSPPAEEIPPLPSSSELTHSYENSFIRVVATLLGLVVLVGGTFWVLKRLGRGNFGKHSASKSITILERRPLSPKTVLYLVEVEERRVLVSESQFEVRALTTIDPVEEESED